MGKICELHDKYGDMRTVDFDISFQYENNLYEGKCTKFKVGKHPQINVALYRKKGQPTIFNFYQMPPEARKKIFWFEFQNELRQALAKEIAKKLSRRPELKHEV